MRDGRAEAHAFLARHRAALAAEFAAAGRVEVPIKGGRRPPVFFFPCDHAVRGNRWTEPVPLVREVYAVRFAEGAGVLEVYFDWYEGACGRCGGRLYGFTDERLLVRGLDEDDAAVVPVASPVVVPARG